jgi:hypothetical protein
MAILKNWLDGPTALLDAVENKFTMLPKIGSKLRSFDSILPTGYTGFPNPPAFPVPDFSKLPNPPKLTGAGPTYAQVAQMRAQRAGSNVVPPLTKIKTPEGSEMVFAGSGATFTYK